jgi:hypothetical protein
MAQPAIRYYAWQVEVLLNNMLDIGINLNWVDIVCCIDNEIPEEWDRLRHKYPARFFFYTDTRTTKNYISSIRPNILKQHWEKNEYLENEVIFYHDCDIMFTKNPKYWITNEMLTDDKWYGSDVRWYIGHDYILSKGEDVLDLMCSITSISKETVKKNEHNCIGAQYLMKRVNYEYWDWVEMKSEKLYKEITRLNSIKKENNSTYHELQIWCSDMWAVLWKSWLMEVDTVPDSNFNFSWGTSSEKDFFDCNVMHNAGVTSHCSEYFFKGKYMTELPFESLEPKRETASWHYWKLIQKTKQNTCLL